MKECFFLFAYDLILKGLIVLRRHTGKRVVTRFLYLFFLDPIVLFHLIKVVEKCVVSELFHGFGGKLEVFTFNEFRGLLVLYLQICLLAQLLKDSFLILYCLNFVR